MAPEPPTSTIETDEPLFLPSDDPVSFPAPPHEGAPAIAEEKSEEPAPSAPPSGVTSPQTATSDEEEHRGRDNTRPSLKRKALGSPLRSLSPEPTEAIKSPLLERPPKESVASTAPRIHSGPVQMVLNTAGASWAMQKGTGGSSMKGDVSKPPVGSGSALKGMRNILNQFKRGDAGVAQNAESEDGENEDDDEMVLDEVDEPEAPAKDDDSAMDMGQARLAPWIPSPTSGPATTRTATRVVEIIDIDQQVDVQNNFQDSSNQPNSSMVVLETLSTGADEHPSIKVPSERKTIEIAPNDEVVRSPVVSVTTIRFDLPLMEASWRAATSSLNTSATSAPDHPTSSLPTVKPSEITSNACEAEATLSRVVSKDDFGRMDVLGQFNRAFVITRLWKPTEGHDDLFIVDQHAADEKYNFERLQTETRIESQKLIK